MAFEWVLATPRSKEFEEIKSLEVETETIDPASKLPIVKRMKHVVEEKKRVIAPANRVRITDFKHDFGDDKFYIRFIYGRTYQGKFQGAVADDGIVYMGEGYYALGVDPTDGFQHDELLKMVADVLKWDGSLQQVAD